MAVIPQLHRNMVSTESVEQPIKGASCCSRTTTQERLVDRTFATSRQDLPGAAMGLAQRFNGEGEFTFCATSEMRIGNRGRKAAVTLWASGEHQQMLTSWVCYASTGFAGTNGEFCTKDGWKTKESSSSGKANNAVEAIVIGQRKCTELEANCLSDKFFWITRSIEKTET
jgi:hypothetical protein